MILLRPEEMKKVDEYTIKKGFPEVLLMEAAGRGTAEYADKIIKGNNILIFAGKGNNGGDGFAAARFLSMWGYNVKIIILGKRNEIKGVSETNLKLLCDRNIIIKTLDECNKTDLKFAELEADLIIDALLGTGLSGEVRGDYAKIISFINKSDKEVLAVDIPSGLDGKDGTVHGIAVKADYTATMAFKKTGLCLYPGITYSGEVRVIDLGMTEKHLEAADYDTFMISQKEVVKLLPDRVVTGHKGTFGRVVIIGGSRNLIGAPALTGNAALVTGSGLVRLAVSSDVKKIIAPNNAELIFKELPENDDGIICSIDSEFDKLSRESDVIAAGPGIGKSPEVTEIIYKLIKEYKSPLVLDADGINAIDNPNILLNRDYPLVITPHPGEMARLLEVKIDTIQENRMKIAREFAVEYGVILVLKGAASLVALPEGELYINPTGNEGMATAGSGDVLTGIISSFIGQGVSPDRAAVLGTFLHGLAGDLAVENTGSYGVTAEILIKYISIALQYLLNKYSN